jgi:hypothetical protein
MVTQKIDDLFEKQSIRIFKSSKEKMIHYCLKTNKYFFSLEVG